MNYAYNYYDEICLEVQLDNERLIETGKHPSQMTVWHGLCDSGVSVIKNGNF